MGSFGRRLQRSAQYIAALPPVDSGDPLALLPRVPWHGGPAYYSTFAYSGMLASTASVPMFTWYGNIDSSNAAAEKAAGINGFFKVTDSTKLVDVANAGLVVIPNLGEYTGTPGSEVIGWHGADEIDMINGAGWTSGYQVMKDVMTPLPNDGRVTHNNYGKGVMYWAQDAEAATFINGGDATDSWRQDTVSSDLYWYAGIESLKDDAVYYMGRQPDQVARSQNYGWMVDRQRYLQTVGPRASSPKPIYSFVEVSHCYEKGSMPTPLQAEGAVWNSFIHEAAGIIYFHHSFTDPTYPAWSAGTQYKLGDNVMFSGSKYCAANLETPTLGLVPTSDTAWIGHIWDSSVGMRNLMVPGMSAHLGGLAARVQALAPVLNSQSVVWLAHIDMETMLKAPGDGYMYLFAMQTIENTSGTYTLSLPPGVTAASAAVLHESRTVPIEATAYNQTYAYTGAAQSWVVPIGVTEVTVELYAAGGGSGGAGVVGKGAFVTAILATTPGETLQINVGGKGDIGKGGWNGGGKAPVSSSGGGGGATDIRRGGTALADRIIVAGGGGGVGNYGGGDPGGNGGLNGAASVGSGGDGGTGGTQTAGGTGYNGGANGALGVGGATTSDGGGGGGGYYGGGGGGYYHGGGGGGSSLTTGASVSDATVTAGARLGDGYIVIRTSQINSESRTITDTFSDEYTCHIYKVKV